MREEITTTDLSYFSCYELGNLVDLLNAWKEQGLPKDFYDNEVVPMLNRDSGNVFLTNSEYQVAMLNGSKLDIFNICPVCGCEGFPEDCKITEEGCQECND